MDLIGNNILFYINDNYNSLTRSLQKIASIILATPSIVIDNTSTELSEIIGVSETTIIRFCKVLGFKGYSDFKIRLAKELGADNQEPVPIGINRSDSPIEVVKKVLLLESQDINYTLDMLDSEKVSRCLKLINSADNLAFFGVGSSSNVANNAKEHFLNFGKKAFAETESLAQIALANSLGKEDVAFIISISGESHIPLEVSHIAKKNGAKTICLTQNPTSRLSINCDCSLICYRKSGILDDLGTVSRTINTSIIDAIAIACITMSWEEATAKIAKNRQKFRELQFAGNNNYKINVP